MKQQIFLVEDDADIARLVGHHLEVARLDYAPLLQNVKDKVRARIKEIRF